MFNPHDYNADLIDAMADQAEALEAELDFEAFVAEQEAIKALTARLEQCETVEELLSVLEA